MIWIKFSRIAVSCLVTRRQFSKCWLRSRSAPVTLQVLGVGLLPMGRRHPARCSFEHQKIIGTPPRSKWCTAMPAGGPCVHRCFGLRPGRTQPTRSGSLAGASRSHTRSLRVGCNHGRECLEAESDLVAGRQPLSKALQGMPDSVYAKARSTSNALPSRSM
jgi:hypothetical protein